MQKQQNWFIICLWFKLISLLLWHLRAQFLITHEKLISRFFLFSNFFFFLLPQLLVVYDDGMLTEEEEKKTCQTFSESNHIYSLRANKYFNRVQQQEPLFVYWDVCTPNPVGGLVWETLLQQTNDGLPPGITSQNK